jgi:hypothetical protein
VSGERQANPEIKAINMMSRLEHVEEEKVNYDFFLNLPEIDRTKLNALIFVLTVDNAAV